MNEEIKPVPFNKRDEFGKTLLLNIKTNLPELEQLLEDTIGHWNYEDYIYRFYHHSWKVFYTQELTIKIVSLLKSLLPEIPIDKKFLEIFKEGTGKRWDHNTNDNWLKETRPIVEAFLHAKYFLEMVVKYGKKLDVAPSCLPSGWASVLYFYGIR